MSFSDKLIFFRTRYGLSKNELGERLGLSTKIINDWEKGKSLPDDFLYGKLSEIFGIKRDFFTDDSLSYKNIEDFNRDDYWGISLTRLDCEGYIERSKKVSKYLSMGIYFALLIPILIIILDKIVPTIFRDISLKTIFTLKIISSLILLILAAFFVYLSNRQKEKYKFVDNGMMYSLKKNDRIYVENIIDQEKPKAMQKIIFGIVFIVLALIILFNINAIFAKASEFIRVIILLVAIFLINEGLNFILNYSIRLSNIKKLLNNQNSYSFDDKNL
ncbi:MAG: helix-turn-helix transcriptional regulator [Peptoniphilaceae bacterium]|nr:helix-turn-helix transcriptional regulator [Peptoniphilaceae bacterium]MDY6018539.1 helix-turn-helix transcriptional regulator [Anaerococcus sp.]